MRLDNLTTEARLPASSDLDRLTSLELVRLMNAEDAQVPQAVGQIAETIALAIDLVADRLQRGGRLIWLGAGTSGRLGVLDAAECPPTFNTPPWQVVGLIAGGPDALTRAVEGAEDCPQRAIDDLRRIDVSRDDVVVGIATSGRTPYVLGGLTYARQIAASTIGITCNADTDLMRLCDITLAPIVGPEILSGSTRLKAGTATKLVLNMLSTGAMVRLGKTYGNLMVDLQATNAKLTDRSRRIVSALTGLDEEQSAALLDRCGGDVKTSILVHQRGISVGQAQQQLEHARGRLRVALTADLIAPHAPAAEDSPPFLVLGVDGGGSKTRAWLADAGESSDVPLGEGFAGPSNPLAVGWHAAVSNIDRAVECAFTSAGIARRQVAAACLAIAGMGRDDDRERLRTWAAGRRIAEHVQVVHDAHAALAAGTDDGIGVAVIAGTGSLAYGQNVRGDTARAGGWGPVIGDDGSGYAIARAALRAITSATDGTGPATRLTDRICRTLEIRNVMDLRSVVSPDQFDPQQIAAIAPVVIDVAGDGDEPAEEIVSAAAQDLASLALTVHRQLDDSTNRIALAVAGGMLVHAEMLRRRMLDAVRQAGIDVTHARTVEEPVAGAVRLARSLYRHVAMDDPSV